METNGKKLYKAISDDIVDKIKSGKLSAGDKLPRTADLAAAYGVSKVTVERALKTLKEMNVIYCVKKAGTFVNGRKNAGQKIFALIITNDDGDYAKIIKAAQVTALINNCFLEVMVTYGDGLKEAEKLERALKSDYDGVMVYPVKGYDNVGLYSALLIKNVPFIFLDRRVDGIRAPLITPDNYRGASLRLNTLPKTGIKTLGSVTLCPTPPRRKKSGSKGSLKAWRKAGLK